MAKHSDQFEVVIEKDSDGYMVAWVPALPGYHTQARSNDELEVVEEKRGLLNWSSLRRSAK